MHVFVSLELEVDDNGKQITGEQTNITQGCTKTILPTAPSVPAIIGPLGYSSV